MRKTLVLFVFVLTGAWAVLTLATAPTYGQAPVFTKALNKVNGVTVTSPPASLNNGDVLDWVMTYQFIHNPAQPAQANIQDMLPSTLQYVPGSLQVPPPWSKQWFNASWITSEPAAAQGVGATLSFPRVVPSGPGQTILIPSPPAASVNTTGSGGDGYRAIPYNGNVYVINHHTSGTYLDCFVAVTGLRCTGYPTHVPVTNGTPFNNSTDNFTPGKPVEYLDRVQGRLYFPVMKTNASPPHDLGILCANLVTKTSCGFYNLETFGANFQNIAGIGGIGGKVYAQLQDGKIGCLDTTTVTPTPCAGQPYSMIPGYSFAQTGGSSEILGTKIYSIWETSAAAFFLSCFDTLVPGPCAGWGTNPQNVPGRIGILYPLLNTTGTVTGICVHTTSGGSGFNCFDPSTGSPISASASLPFPTSYTTWVNTFGGGVYQSVGYGQTGYYKTRVFNSNSSAIMGCYDFATQAPCGGSFPISGVTTRHYATIADPERPGCMWYYGDDGKLGSFLAADGSACDSTTVVDTIVTPANSYCAGGTVSGWGRLSMSGLTLGGGITATFTLYDGSNPANLAVNASAVPYAQNLPVASLPLTLGTGGLGIGYGTGPGQYKSLKIVLQFKGVTNHTPWTNTPPPSVEVSWSGGPPQFCFQTKVATCSRAAVTNQATAVTTPATGAPFYSLAPQPAFSAAHVLGSECPAPIDPCCPPWNPARLAEMMFYKGSGSISAPYTLNFQPTASFKSQIQAYIDYLHSFNPAIQKITIAWRLHNQGTGNTPTIPLGPQVNVTAYTTWSSSGNGTPSVAGDPNFFSLPNPYPMVIGTWYRVHTGIYLEGGHVFFGDKCANNEIWVRVQVLPKAGGASAAVLEFWNWSNVMRRVRLGDTDSQ